MLDLNSSRSEFKSGLNTQIMQKVFEERPGMNHSNNNLPSLSSNEPGPDPIRIISHVKLCYASFERSDWSKKLNIQS